jgi:hypothetical protein
LLNYKKEKVLIENFESKIFLLLYIKNKNFLCFLSLSQLISLSIPVILAD